jgi:D-alanine transaminase
MSRVVYVNGEYVHEEDAKISVFDRGFLFADGVYEVSAVIGGKLIDNDAHLRRLERSLAELKMGCPVPVSDIPHIQRELVEVNGVDEGMVYLQVSRGVADRDFSFPKEEQPSLVLFTQARPVSSSPKAARGIRVISQDDVRWGRRDIKTVQLLAQSLAKQAALSAGADDAWMVEDGFVTEGSSNNAFIITTDGVLITRQLGNDILHGITRRTVLDIAKQENLTVEERPFTIEEAQGAAEAFSTSASAFVMPVISIDNKTISQGVPGPITQKLRERYIELAMETAS